MAILKLIADILITLGISLLIITQKISIYDTVILSVGVVLLLINYTRLEVDFIPLFFQWTAVKDAIIGFTGIITLSAVLIISLAEFLESPLSGVVVGSLAIYTLAYLYLQIHGRYRSLRRRERYIRERFPQLRQQPPIPRRMRRPLRTKGFSEVNPIEYSKIPRDAVDPFVHDKIHDLITKRSKIMKCDECGVYFDKEVWEYFGKTCTRIGCKNNLIGQ